MRIQFIALTGALVSALACAEGSGGTEVTADFSRADAAADACPEPDCEPQPDAGATYDAAEDPQDPIEGPTDACGDGKLGRSEACDDGNRRSGDGCEAECLAVEPGYACQPAGSACGRIARCGDGQVVASEQCDDANRTDGDGCSAACKLEHGFKCEGAPSACVETTCGDGKREGAESCDDGNVLPFDGCSASCQGEPQCRAGAACTSTCGDGLVLHEDCDDGNRRDGDGCSADCKVEAGFRCTVDRSCGMAGDRCVMRVPVIYRDFNASHSDFEIDCGGTILTGIVQSTLSERGKPLLRDGSGACIESASSFGEWYTTSADNATIPGSLVLYEDGSGGFVNHYGPNGEPWLGPAGEQQSYGGNPLFFPIDDSPLALDDERSAARIPEQYGYGDWPWEGEVRPSARDHNFHFTTEVVYWFQYDASRPATLDFLGDDDVWVFINGSLAVDLGGSHGPEAGSVTLDAQGAADFGLADGEVYEIRVFHAERRVEGSSFKLTLRNFQTNPSACTPVCGDLIVTAGEECDDGANDGGYDQCAPGCVLGPSCGDGVVQEGEDCDDGNRIEGDGCGSACRSLLLL